MTSKKYRSLLCGSETSRHETENRLIKKLFIIITDTPTNGGNIALKHYRAFKHVILYPAAITKIGRGFLALMPLHYGPNWQSCRENYITNFMQI